MKKRVPKFLRNKYILATGFFLLWICLFNDIDLFYIIRSKQEVNALRTEVEELERNNTKELKSLAELTSSQKSLEKFARETYYMKRDNEEVYVFKERVD
jgi:cell division protein FtsB